MCRVATLHTAKLNHARCDIAIISGAMHWSATQCAGDFFFYDSTEARGI